MERKSSEDAIFHLLIVTDEEDGKSYEIEHPGCPTKVVELDSIGGDAITYEHYNCRMQWASDNSGLNYLEHEDGSEGWMSLEPGIYRIASYTEYRPGEFGGTYGEEWDTGVRLIEPIPISEQITMRPVWRRRQRRHYLQSELAPPSEAEMIDAIRVLEDPENQLYAPALYLEAERIYEEATA